VGNVSTNVYAKFRCVPLHIKKALGIVRELIPTTRTTTTVAFWDPPSGSKKLNNNNTMANGYSRSLSMSGAAHVNDSIDSSTVGLMYASTTTAFGNPEKYSKTYRVGHKDVPLIFTLTFANTVTF